MELDPVPRAFNELVLVPEVVFYGSLGGARRVRQPVRFLDLVVDGVSLRSMAEHAGCGVDLVTPLCRRWVASHVAAAADQLLRGGGGADAPIEMLVCSVCGDRGCGAVLADVRVGSDQVVWSSWRWADSDPFAGELLDIPVMHFERSAYEQLFAAATARVTDLPDDATPDRRSERWPWRWGWRLPRSDGRLPPAGTR